MGQSDEQASSRFSHHVQQTSSSTAGGQAALEAEAAVRYSTILTVKRCSNSPTTSLGAPSLHHQPGCSALRATVA
ncbi:hypothetical protein CEXT_415341 [Caerostris extrusa]|uniref:Uncharacterized protein n=1 Tax=Caerostris extrusa TaxID=172846 RepID=A0AAV4WBV6_CAEEX|nr:hypothetical protein CEXT_415341 [Caerostris extrusa]